MQLSALTRSFSREFRLFYRDGYPPVSVIGGGIVGDDGIAGARKARLYPAAADTFAFQVPCDGFRTRLCYMPVFRLRDRVAEMSFDGYAEPRIGFHQAHYGIQVRTLHFGNDSLPDRTENDGPLDDGCFAVVHIG